MVRNAWGKGDEPERVPARHSQRIGGLALPAIDGLDAGPEDLGQKGGVTERQRHDGAPGEIEVAHGQRRHPFLVDGRGQQPVGALDHGWGPHEGDVEEHHQQRNSANDLDIERGHLPQHPKARRPRHGHDKADEGGEDKGDRRDPERGGDAARERIEDGAHALVGDDLPEGQDAEQDDREQPPGYLTAAMGRGR